ncbi:unnamed protein product [marine sediment metagenome]|uniref:Uncharacterized protein n=1 Tax=marine sediment metagenome TaxID=412755 RepID=X1KU04_9ZZZZ
MDILKAWGKIMYQIALNLVIPKERAAIFLILTYGGVKLLSVLEKKVKIPGYGSYSNSRKEY